MLIKRLSKVLVLALTIITISTPMLNTALAMESSIETPSNKIDLDVNSKILMLNKITEEELEKEKLIRESFNENTSNSELFSEGQVKLTKIEFQQENGIEDKFILTKEENGVKVEVNGAKGIIKLTSKEDGEIILNYFENLDNLHNQYNIIQKAPNRPANGWSTQGPDNANMYVTKGSTRDTITASKPTGSRGSKTYTKPTNNWYSGYTKGYYDNVGNARKSWGTAKKAIGGAAQAGFTTTVATFVANKKFNIGPATLKVALSAGVISAAKDLSTALSYGVAYLGHMGAVDFNYANL